MSQRERHVPARRATLQDEAKESSGVTSSLLLGYIEQSAGPAAVAAVLRHCGLEGCEAELRDENTWFSWETKIALFEATAAVLDKPGFLYEMAEYAIDARVARSLVIALRRLGSPGFVLRNIVRANARFNRSHVLELVNLGDGHAVLHWGEKDGRRAHRLDCDYTAAMLAVIPKLFGLPRARVSHAQCASDGADGCVFELHWTERSPADARMVLAGAGATVSLAVAALALPTALPIIGLTGAAAAAVLAREQWTWRREQSRHLRRQLADNDQETERLLASLKDLVSDLRLDEVVGKVTRHAQAAVGGREFLLLARDGDGLICRSSSGLPAEAIAAVEAWANDTPRALDSPMLIDSTGFVPALSPLAGLADPLGSLASAPLGAGGEAFGLLVSLGGQEQTFLPRDMDVLESYAAQVSVALRNAHLYQSERSLAERDPLTGLLNHRRFHEAMDVAVANAANGGPRSSVVLIDLDRFKQVNDEDGHAEGDRVLRAAARALADACRQDDLAFRVGGDEFALLLPGIGETDAANIAERVSVAIARIDPRMEASAGVACTEGAARGKDDLLAEADRRLYAAKRASARVGRARSVARVQPLTTRSAIDLLLGTLELHHGESVEHSHTVAELAVAVAIRLGLDGEECELVAQTALIHDLGKLSVPREILDQPRSLTDAEWRIVRRHPVAGEQLLRRVPGLDAVADAVRASHERWDGAGYPDGRSGEAIPQAARVVAACDAYEAMTGDRPYRPRLTPAEAAAELRACAGSQFDPLVVAALVDELAASHVALSSHAPTAPAVRPTAAVSQVAAR